MGIARVERPESDAHGRHDGFVPGGEGFLIIALIAASWAATLAVGWVIWRLVVL